MRKLLSASAMLMVLALVAGCPPPTSRQGQGLVTLAKQQFDQQQYAQATQTLTGFLEKESRSGLAGEAYYLRGLCYRQMGPAREGEAERDLQEAVKMSREASVRGLANVALGHLCYETRPGHLEQAVGYYEAALKDLSKEPPLDAVLLRLGASLQRLGRWSEADPYLSRCYDEFPESSFARYARERFGARTWRLQFGAFSEMSRATRVAEQVRSAGMTADVQPVRQEGKVLYAVRSGSYGTHGQAEGAAGPARAVAADVTIVATPPGPPGN